MDELCILTAATVLSLLMVSKAADLECAPKVFGKEQIVCVCNATYCDTVEPPERLPTGQYLLYTSTPEGLRFNKSTGSFYTCSGNTSYSKLDIDASKRYQKICGFGTSFTDAAGINTISLSPETQANLMRSFFSSSGIEIGMGRVPIGGSDFSTHTYTYDDVEYDVNLTRFNLTQEDFNYKIPFIRWAQELRGQSLKLVASAWSSPVWMKTNLDFVGGYLKEKFYQNWADYHMKFLDAYKENGIKVWAVTTGNEPYIPADFYVPWNTLIWTQGTHRKWISENLGPTLRSSQHSNVKILANDDQRSYLLRTTNIMMADKRVQNYVDGFAVHWYQDKIVPASVLSYTHNKFPSKLIISTEACRGETPYDRFKVSLGDWSRAEDYMIDIIDDINNWVNGWIEWNFALDLEGGPNWAENFVDSTVIVNATSDEFYKQPMFYALGHFSKFIPEDSVRIDIKSSSTTGLLTAAFSTPDGATVITIYNKRNCDRKVTITDPTRGCIDLTVRKKSFNTLLYW